MAQADMTNNLEQTKASIESLLEEIEHHSSQESLGDARRDPWRYTWAAAATVELVEPGDSEDSSELLYVTTHTISATSVDFYSARELEPDCKVMITLDTEKGPLCIPATVIHAVSSVGRPLVAVRFDLE